MSNKFLIITTSTACQKMVRTRRIESKVALLCDKIYNKPISERYLILRYLANQCLTLLHVLATSFRNTKVFFGNINLKEINT